jgi:hypothetical protein
MVPGYEARRYLSSNIIRKHNTHHRPIPPLNGRVIFDEKCSILRNALFPEKIAPSLQIPPDFVDSKVDLRTELDPITIREAHNTLKRTRIDSAGGHDGFLYTPIIRLYEKPPGPQILPDLFNTMFKYSAHPLEWKVENCVLYLNKGKQYIGANVDTQMGGRKDYSAVDVLINISTPMSQSLKNSPTQSLNTKNPAKTIPPYS